MPQHGNNSKALSDEDQMALIWIAPLAATMALGSAGLWWSTAIAWMVDHSILIASEASPMAAIPASDGAGLDGRRLIVALAVVIALGAVAISAGRTAYSARQARLHGGDRG